MYYRRAIISVAGAVAQVKGNMGWLNPEEQKEVRKKFHVVAYYMCDYCGKPISILEMPVVDSKKGFHKWNRKRSPKECRSFHGREPKRTYHQGYCNDMRLGRKHKPKDKDYTLQGEDMPDKKKKHSNKSSKSKKAEKKSKKSSKSKKEVKADPKVTKAVLALITKKENHYDKRRILAKLKDKFDKADLRAAIAALWAKKTVRKTDGKYHLVEEKEEE